MTNPYTEHATMTTLYEREVEKNKGLTLALKVTWFCVGVAIVGYAMLIVVGIKMDPVVRVGCPQFQEITLPVSTPTK